MKIHFVGAGPGAPDLITLKGRKLLDEADTVIYAGSLVNPALLCGIQAEIMNSAEMTLVEVTAAMKAAYRAGKKVVRLHTGDPSLYGAIREQMEVLDKAGIPYEVVPGVSSFLGAAAALRCEYTLPEVAQTVIITRLGGRTPVPEKERLSLLAAHGCTMCIFLSVHRLSEVVAELQEGGYGADTPAAVVQKATWPEERIFRGTLATLTDKVEAIGIDRTAMIVVGRCLGDDYALSRLYSPDFSHGFRAAE